jgi:hypothetical protein
VGGGWNRLRILLTRVEFEGGRWMEQAKERVKGEKKSDNGRRMQMSFGSPSY